MACCRGQTHTHTHTDNSRLVVCETKVKAKPNITKLCTMYSGIARDASRLFCRRAGGQHYIADDDDNVVAAIFFTEPAHQQKQRSAHRKKERKKKDTNKRVEHVRLVRTENAMSTACAKFQLVSFHFRRKLSDIYNIVLYILYVYS